MMYIALHCSFFFCSCLVSAGENRAMVICEEVPRCGLKELSTKLVVSFEMVEGLVATLLVGQEKG